LIIAVAAVALTACSEQEGDEQNILVGDNAEVGTNAEIETLPADESSTTPSDELQNGFVADDAANGAASNGQ
jgi:hypothetical protein